MTDWKPVANALLGSWPSQVNSWGREVLAAYLSELQAREITPERALTAIRAATGQFPPSASELAALARRDPDRPTFDELYAGLYAPGGLYGFKRSGVTVSPWVLKFAEGKDWLRYLPLESDDPAERGAAMKRLRTSWEQFLQATGDREVHEIASRSSRGSLGRPDFAGALGRGSE